MPLVTIGAASHPGLKRKDNQDYFDYRIPDDDAGNNKGLLMTVADGMGGKPGGAQASSLAVSVLMREYYTLEFPKSIPESMKNAFLTANREVLKKGHGNKDLEGMCTTMTAFVLKNRKLYYAHVGDSRGYHITEKKIMQFTQDHSFVAKLVKIGAISDEEARIHPERHVITRAIGMDSELTVDVSKGHRKIKAGQYVLLCSDGLYNVVSDEEILDTVNHVQVPDEICKTLLDTAIEEGGPDNITVLLARVDKSDQNLSLVGKCLKIFRDFFRWPKK
ncbi:Stp1/IreP family PP2C-type Ser/Thr phosphatase [bacterium]|nr:Stp1/IreP family PP2C-type Ser/Thr phosphatase [bacterium]